MHKKDVLVGAERLATRQKDAVAGSTGPISFLEHNLLWINVFIQQKFLW